MSKLDTGDFFMCKRVYTSFFLLMVVLGIVIVNIAFIMQNPTYRTASQSMGTKSRVLAVSRGAIYDCNMNRIVNSQHSYITACLPTENALKKIRGFDITNNMPHIAKTDTYFYDKDIKSVVVAERYSENQPCVHLIGHLDESNDGVMGLERAYNNYLRNQAGELRARWSTDALGNILYGEGISIENENYLSPAGIQLTIDLRIQRIAENILESNISKGAVVIMNGETNELLASASVPEFDPVNIQSSLSGNDSPFLNRAFIPYSVGSVFKPIVACCALESGISFTYECTGSIKIGSSVFRCSNNKVHGNVDLSSAMEQSCNVYFIALGQKIGAEKLLSLCEDFGLGKEIELADNYFLKSGNLPKLENISSPQALSNLSFGQGELLASPIQMAVAYSCFANGGYYREPTIMKGIIDEKGDVIQKVQLPEKHRIINESTARIIDGVLRNVVENGNGRLAFSHKTVNHGKTATAQSGWYEDGREITHTWFCGYFLHNGTTYVVVIFKEDGSSGAEDCAPLFKEISDMISLL